MHIIILYPAVKNTPIGGLQVIYEYANRLVQDGHKITFVYASYFRELDVSVLRKIKCCIKYIYSIGIRKLQGCKWFNLSKNVEEKFVFEYSKRNIPQGDAYIATAVITTTYLNELTDNTAKRFYFIQDYERFIIDSDEIIRRSYQFPFTKIVVSGWLKKLVEEFSSQYCHLVINGFDAHKYYITKPIKAKNKYSVSMLYHTRIEKDIPTGLQALKIVKERIPQLTVNMFGVYKRPSNLPSWIHYIQAPAPQQHLEINNESAIYMGCSKSEGWGLTIGEAMMCGQAVVCTNNKGYLEMAKDGFNALISPIEDATSLANNIIKLITDDSLRFQIANNGLKSIQSFSIEESYLKFKEILER